MRGNTPIRPDLVILLHDHPVIPRCIVKARKVKVDLHLRKAGETPEWEVRDLVDWPKLS